MLAPQYCQKLFSYVTGKWHLCWPMNNNPSSSWSIGWLTVAGWQASIASSAYLEGVLIQNLIEVVSPDYTPKLWHGTLLCYGVLLVCVFVNTLAGTKLPRIEIVLLVVYVLSFIGIVVPLVYLAPHGNAHDVFATFVNGGGWSTQGLSFFVGLSGNAFAFLGKPYLTELATTQLIQVQVLIASTTWVCLSFTSSDFLDWWRLDERRNKERDCRGSSLDCLWSYNEWCNWFRHSYCDALLPWWSKHHFRYELFISFHSNLCASNKVQRWQCRHGSVDSPGGTRSWHRDNGGCISYAVVVRPWPRCSWVAVYQQGTMQFPFVKRLE